MSSSPIDSNRSWRLLAHYLKPHRAQIALLLAVLLGAIAVQIATPLVASRFINGATSGGAMDTLITLAIVTVALGLAGQALSVLETWLAESVSWSATNDLRTDLAAHLLRLDATFHSDHTQGELIERVDGDVGALARFFSRFVVSILGNGLLMIGILALLLGVDWRIAAGLGAFVAVAMVAMLWIRAAATPYSEKERQASAEYYGFLSEYLAGLEDVRSCGAGPYVIRRCIEQMRSWMRAVLRAQVRGYALIATGQGIFGLGMAFAFGICAALFRDGSLTLGTVYLVIRYADMLRRPTEQLRDDIQDFQQADASLRRIESLFAEQSRVVDGPGEALPSGSLSLELDNVSFGYRGNGETLRDITLRLDAGRVLGVVGRTGSGKTTLTRLLTRFHDPQRGAVRIGETDLRDVSLHAVRSRIGFVSQEVHLFNATVRDNVTLFDSDVPDEQVTEALDAIGLASWRRTLPDGIYTVLGSGEAGLSAGQAQLLACARILLRDPDLVILDEASSRLDPATERLVHRALGRLLSGRTGVIVAHRLDTVAYADDILVLEGGRAIEHGPRLELAADSSSHFAELLRRSAGEVAA